ncbi:MAG: hypothetical protein EU539_12955 [Promethearchaeota archaeon]|nr:MAG: hypothetical protein EU539_12955 [Candidatus Lokiarchaeota archaeon]
MSIENPNVLERIKRIEKKLENLENRISYIESIIDREHHRPPLRPQPGPSPPGPGPRPEPFRF